MFQTDSPFAPMLYEHLYKIMEDMMEKFIKADVLKKAISITELILKFLAYLI